MAFLHTASGTGTDQEMLDAIRAEIVRIACTGQGYRNADGESMTRADLGELKRLEQQLQGRVDAAANGITKNLVEFNRRP